MEKLLHLILNILAISLPLVRSFEHRVQFAGKWHEVFPSISIIGLLYLDWKHFSIVMGFREFNPQYLTGIFFCDLPLVEYQYSQIVPFIIEYKSI
jgi:hypothetical protein